MRETGNQFFDNLPNDQKEQFAILFEDKSSWFTIDKNGKQNWSNSEKKQKQFWETIKTIKNNFETMSHLPAFYDFSFVEFPTMLTYNCCGTSPVQILLQLSNKCLFCFFYKAVFHGEVTITNSKFQIDLNFEGCEFKNVFSLIECEIKSIDFSNTTFKKEVEIRKSIFTSGTKFNNTIFEGNIKFEELHFKDNVNLSITSNKESSFNDLICEKMTSFGGANFIGSTTFNGCKFNDFTDFTKTVFREQVFISSVFFYNVYFIETKFLSSIRFYFSKAELFTMKRVIIRKIALNNVFFKDADIIDLFTLHESEKMDLKFIPLSKENIKDRETARILKLLFDKRGNIQDSNNLFKIEQEFYMQELTSDTKPPSPYKIKNIITLYLNKYISNFGTDWIQAILALFLWAVAMNLYYGLINKEYVSIFSLNLSLWDTIGTYFNTLTKMINPINAFKDESTFTNHEFFGAIVRIVSATIIYQIIISFRQFTRRG